MEVFGDVIKRPTDSNILALLAVKIKQYEIRMAQPCKTEESLLDAYCKRSLCQLILTQEQVTTNDFVTLVSQTLISYFSPDDLEGRTINAVAEEVALKMMGYIIRAWAVINDYCQTGGMKTRKNNPHGYSLN